MKIYCNNPLLSLIIFTASTSFAISQTTYTWIGASPSNWTTSSNWSPDRISPMSNDILIFDLGGTVTVTEIPTEVIGQLFVSGGTIVNFQASAPNTISVNGAGGTDVSIEAGSQLNFSGDNAIALNLGSTSTALIGGDMTFSGNSMSTDHRLSATSTGAIIFQSGSSFTSGAKSGGSVFSQFVSNKNSVIFQAGSTYIHQAGSNPFGLNSPESVVTFQTGSLFRLTGTSAPSFSGRTYADLEFSGGNFSVTGSSPVSIDNLTINSGNININMGGTGHSIKGNISVNGGSLNFNTSGTSTINLNGSSPQTISGLITGSSTSTISIPNGSYVDLGSTGSIVTAGQFIVAAVATINLGATQTISGSGNFDLSAGGTLKTANSNGIQSSGAIGSIITNSRNFNSAANYEFQGSSTGIFSTSPTLNTVNNLTINSPTSDVLLGQNLTSTGTLSLTSGKLNLNGFTLTFSGSVAGIPAWGSSTSNYIIASTGFLVRNDPGNTIFPVGTASQYLPCKLTGGGAYYVNLSSPPSPGLTQPSLALPNQWNITGSGSTSMDFQWPSDIFGTLAYMYKYDGANWTNAAGPTTTNGTGPITVGFSGIEVTCCTGFTVGGLGALPVELVYFTAEASDETTVLTWQTASERNNDYFSIQKSSDGLDFMEIGQVLGNGTSLETNAYTFTDERPVVGLNYYRLKQVDFDGQFTYSKIVSVKMTSKASFEVYPSITSGDLTIKSTDEGQDVQEILIFDSMGRLAHSYEVEESGPYTKLNVAGLPNGAYYLKIATGRCHETLRFTKI